MHQREPRASAPVSGPSHPFRRALTQTRQASAEANGEEDLKLFVVSFTAFFVCFYTFLL
ncbi:hypothetical protein [Sphingomonas sp. 3-13AW]|jgi:hypothetical protein|uniref:hypothetical protein n=1 Tax=Sphingomonas sp. 3-13AW TaxID=3050450 RepID=UPI003BB70DA2